MDSEVDWTKVHPMRRGEVWVRRDSDDTAVFEPESGRLYALNAPALALWELCDGDTSAIEMAEALSEVTGQTLDQLIDSVGESLQSLHEQGLIALDR